jgi:hypothetical protein
MRDGRRSGLSANMKNGPQSLSGLAQGSASVTALVSFVFNSLATTPQSFSQFQDARGLAMNICAFRLHRWHLALLARQSCLTLFHPLTPTI